MADGGRGPTPAGEIIPAITADGGTLPATADQPYFILLDSNVAPAASDAVEIVDPAQSADDTSNEDTLFLALARDNVDYVADRLLQQPHPHRRIRRPDRRRPEHDLRPDRIGRRPDS